MTLPAGAGWRRVAGRKVRRRASRRRAALYGAISAEPAAEPAAEPSLQTLLDGLNVCLPALPPPVQAARRVMARHVIVQMCVERERALAGKKPCPPSVWSHTADLLIDALTGLWSAPASRTPAD